MTVDAQQAAMLVRATARLSAVILAALLAYSVAGFLRAALRSEPSPSS
jgi:hypothetical protein